MFMLDYSVQNFLYFNWLQSGKTLGIMNYKLTAINGIFSGHVNLTIKYVATYKIPL